MPSKSVSTTGPEAYGPGFGKNYVVVQVDKALTTGQVAGLCGCSANCVAKWCKAGHLEHYILPCSKDRRVLPASLVRFMRQWGMPIPQELAESVAVCLGVGENEFSNLRKCSLTEVAKLLVTHPVHIAVIGDVEGREIARAAAELIREQSPKAHIILYASSDWRCDPVSPWSVVYYREQTPHNKVPLHPVANV